MSSKYDDLIERLRHGADVSKEEIRQISSEFDTATKVDQDTIWYILELYSLIDYEYNGRPKKPSKYPELLARAKLGRPISKDEIGNVAAELQRQTAIVEAGNPELEETYTLLHILGKYGDTSYIHLVERFLKPPWHELYARLALWILCRWWQMAAQYRKEMLIFMRGVPWHVGDDARWAAVGLAAEYLVGSSDPKLLQELVTIVENEAEEPDIRACACEALSEAMGHGANYAWPPTWTALESKGDKILDPRLLWEAKMRLKQELAN